jgi:hypothetical protein
MSTSLTGDVFSVISLYLVNTPRELFETKLIIRMQKMLLKPWCNGTRQPMCSYQIHFHFWTAKLARIREKSGK